MDNKIKLFIQTHQLVTKAYTESQEILNQVKKGAHAGNMQIIQLCGQLKKQKAMFDLTAQQLERQFKEVTQTTRGMIEQNKREEPTPPKRVGQFLEDSIFNHSKRQTRAVIDTPPTIPTHKGTSAGKVVTGNQDKEIEKVHGIELEVKTTESMLSEKSAILKDRSNKYRKLSKAAREREAGQKKAAEIEELKKECEALATQLAEQKSKLIKE